jgi:PTH1 family peptidyl-tRNA hydrolase
VWGIIGLGNPGARYEGTRHNIGFAVVDLLARRFGVRPQQGTHPFLLSCADVAGESVLLVRPTTYVNRSGVALLALLQEYPELGLSDLLVVVDDVALPFGRLRLRPGGSDGGHNGLRSIEAALGSRDYARLRIGVGAQQPGEDLADHVLGPFSSEEARSLPDILHRAADAVELVLQHGVQAAVPRVNATPPD